MATLNRFVVGFENGKATETYVPLTVAEEAATRAEWAANEALAAAERAKPPPTPAEKVEKAAAALGLTVDELKAGLGLKP